MSKYFADEIGETVSLQEASALASQGTVCFVDIRPIEQFEAMHIKDAQFLPVRMMDALNTSGWDVEAMYIVYGNETDVALLDDAKKRLIDLGFRCSVMDSSLTEWQKSDLPVSKVERAEFCCGRGCCF